LILNKSFPIILKSNARLLSGAQFVCRL